MVRSVTAAAGLIGPPARNVLGLLAFAGLAACGARSSLEDPAPQGDGGGGATTGPGCVPQAEVCNGIDDDCNGVVDEADPSLGTVCRTGLPGACAEGHIVCEAGALSCEGAPGAETCNGLDDDCDGVVDQGDPGGGGPCDTGLVGVCASGTLHCTNGVVACVQDQIAGPEECNGLDDDCDGEADELLTCPRRVFITSELTTGTFGGLGAGDAICQTLADAADLGGTYKAWLSSSTIDARDRLSHVGKPYVLVDGTVVADDWDEFASEHHQHAINLTELFGPPPQSANQVYVYTGTTSEGTVKTLTTSGDELLFGTCGDWVAGSVFTAVGLAHLAHFGWSSASGSDCLTLTGPLYCLEQ